MSNLHTNISIPYGKVLREYVNGEQERYLTTQHERDQETGLDYRGARYYDADVARFLSLDPLATDYPSLSDYSYVAGNPIKFIDPTGKYIIYAGEDKREHRKMMRGLKKKSRTFRKMYRSMQFSTKKYTVTSAVSGEGSQYDTGNKTLLIDKTEKSISGFSVEQAAIHEFGHAWRDHKGLDVNHNDSPYEKGSPENSVFILKMNQSKEAEGLHIENVVRAEAGMEPREEYGLMPDNSAKNVTTSPYTGTRRLAREKGQDHMVKRDSNYNYKSKQNHYKNLKTRKNHAAEVNIHSYSK